jgi:hypothetical protein
MNARDRFRKGDEVCLSPAGMAHLWLKDQRRGEVVGFSRDGTSVRVQWDGNKSVSGYHMDFIEHIYYERVEEYVRNGDGFRKAEVRYRPSLRQRF